MKANVNKSCSCRMCRQGRSSAWGRAVIKRANRKFRYTERELKYNPWDFEHRLVATGYTD